MCSWANFSSCFLNEYYRNVFAFFFSLSNFNGRLQKLIINTP